jgi:phosphatidate cytidylyltransferase
MAGGEAVAKKSDLGVRVASALVMVAVAGTALWLGGWAWRGLVLTVALGVLWEWWGLVRGFVAGAFGQVFWLIGGIAYVGIAGMSATVMREDQDGGLRFLLTLLLAVVCTDIGAYFAGRAIGGPKIAPSISPSKTWAGLMGGMVASAAVLAVPLPWTYHDYDPAQWRRIALLPALIGALIAIVAQAGDFFESWMKRRAGVKDSGSLIPGHGGLFDRADGLIAVLFMIGVIASHSLFISE